LVARGTLQFEFAFVPPPPTNPFSFSNLTLGWVDFLLFPHFQQAYP
jgi:hypothetical protein